MFDRLRRAGTLGLGLLSSRLDLAAAELDQLRAQLLRWLALAIAVALLLALAAAIASFAFIAAYWESWGWRAALVPLGVAVIAAIATAWRLSDALDRAPAVLAATRAELARDREALAAALARDDPAKASEP